ncbi:MAG: hypothetical protein H7276_19465, partial [Caulobacter sp.]|nr:hypothetical protein [Vitreoscilla sp.]
MKAILAAAALGIVLAGCSAGGEPAKTVGGGTTASDLLVTVTTPNPGGLQNTGAQVATVTVTAVDSNRNVVSGATVSIVPDNTAVVSTSSTTTNSAGVVTGTVGIGNDSSNRTVALVISSGSIKKTASFDVVGNVLTATPSPAIVTPGGAGTIQYHLADAKGVAVANVSVAISGTLTATGTTDANGNYTFPYTAPSAEQVLTFNATANKVSVTSTVQDTSGTIAPAVGSVQSASLSSDPSTVGVNAAGSTANQVAVRALFLGASNQPIANVRVRFDLNGDANGIGGTLTSGTDYVYSDANGVARTTYIPGSRSSGNNKLTIRGCWSNSDFAVVTTGAACPNSQAVTSAITVAGASVSIAIDTDNNITSVGTTPTIYQIAYAVQVVDSVGNPQAGVVVSSAVDQPRYYKGYFDVVSGAWKLEGHVSCDNEDVNRNGNQDIFDSTHKEDANNNGVLDPAAAAVTILAQTQTAGLLG